MKIVTYLCLPQQNFSPGDIYFYENKQLELLSMFFHTKHHGLKFYYYNLDIFSEKDFWARQQFDLVYFFSKQWKNIKYTGRT
jgi:hypothetical protein